MSEPAVKEERFHFLDGLRGIAASLIVIHHAFTANIVKLFDHLNLHIVGYYFQNFTQSGVDLFFVLSGVVLLRPYLRKQRQFKVGNYFARRVKRIYPPYFFALLFASFVIWFNNQYPTWYNKNGLRARFFWWETIKEAAIINLDGQYYNLAWWSLQIEIVFYLLAPLFIFIFPRQDRLNGRNIAIAIVITVMSTIGLQLLFTDHLAIIYSLTYNTATIGRFIEYPLCFLMGVLLAAKDFSNRYAQYFILSGLVLIGCAWLHIVPYMQTHYTQFVHPGFALVYAGVIILAFNMRSYSRWLDTPAMIWLGERSYSLFLVHFSVFYLTDNIISHFTSERDTTYALLTRLVGIPIALFAAMLLFHFVERRQARGLVTGDAFWPWGLGSKIIGK